jgi:PAS domain S-box-containing protein
VTRTNAELSFDRDRVTRLLQTLERLAAGGTGPSLEISPLHDELDAVAYGINALADELRWAHARMIESERLRAEELRDQAARLSGANFAAAFHSSPCAMTITRVSDGRFVDVNEGFERHTGFRRDEVIGRTAEEFGLWIHPDDLAAVRVSMRNGGRLRSAEVRCRSRSGALVTTVYSTEIITFNGEPCVLAVGMDVTDRKHAEIQAAVLRDQLAHLGRVTLLNALTGSIAHEISQPLTAVMANAEAALRLLAAQPPRLVEVGEALDEILCDNARAGDVVLRLKALLKKEPSRHEPLDVNGTATEVVKLVHNDAVGRQIVLDVDLAPDLGPVLGDRIQIQQVVLNLLMNAFDAVQECDPADRRVHLHTSSREGTAIVQVSDRGGGLPDEALAHAFDPFYTTKPHGMGLGLSICWTIVAAHGGTLEAARNAGPGMTFTVCLPAWRSVAPEEPAWPERRRDEGSGVMEQR